MREIQLTKGCTALVDDEDYDVLEAYSWHVTGNKDIRYQYAVRWSPRGVDGARNLIFMHRNIMQAIGRAACVDHIDGNGLNNCRRNLRLCSHGQNMKNRRMHNNNTTGYKGVYIDRGMIRSQIKVNGNKIHIGIFKTLVEAAKAYDDMALELHGDFANLNFK